MRYVVGVDIGTSSTKAVLFNTEGRQVNRSAQPYALKVPEPGAAELDADEILQAVNRTVAEVTRGIERSQLVGVSFSAAMHMLLLVDAAGQPLTPVYTWADSRSLACVETVRSKDKTLYSRTGVAVHPMSPLVKLVWLQQSQPYLMARAARVVSIKEYVLYRWCGEWAVDISIAGATGLLNMRSLSWDTGALAIAGLQSSQLSALVPTSYQLRTQPQVARDCGVDVGTTVIIGANDGVLANLGVGALSPETAAITLGTSGAVRRGVRSPSVNPEAQLFCYALHETQWVVGGAVNTGGIALQWMRDRLFGETADFDTLTEMAAAIAPGAEGLIFHPYLLGERAPLWDTQARASFFGLGMHHSRGHLVRAAMEGVLYNLHQVFEALEHTSGHIEELRASGGFVRSPLWQQMLADIFERPIVVPAVVESSAFGAAVLALITLGEWPGPEEIATRSEIKARRYPIESNAKQYRHLRQMYNQLLRAFQPHYETLQQVPGSGGHTP